MSFSLPLEELLRPISEAQPGGHNLRYHALYDDIRKARSADDNLSRGGWERKLKLADWDRVIKLAEQALTTSTKDVQIAAWLTEALAEKHGLPGLRGGLQLIDELLARFWEVLYPEIEDDDLELRAGPLEWLGKILPQLFGQIELGRAAHNGASFTWFEREKNTFDLLEAGRYRDDEDQTKRAQRAQEAHDTAEKLKKVLAQTPRDYHASLAEELLQTSEMLTRLQENCDQHFGKEGPSFKHAQEALEKCSDVIADALQLRATQATPASTATAAPDAPEAQIDDATQRDEFVTTASEASDNGVAANVRVVVPEELLALPQSWEAAQQRLERLENLLHHVLAQVEALRFAENQNDASSSVAEELWVQAEGHLHAGQFQSGLALLKNALWQAHSERERFLHKLLLAEYCLLANKPALAKPLVEECLQKMDVHRLDLWETQDLNVRVWRACHRCYHAIGENGGLGKERLELAFNRLCVLDVEQALLHENF